MTVAGDMAAYVSSKAPGIDMPTARVVIALALEAADDPNFATRFQQTTDCASSFCDYFNVIRFLKDMNQ